MGWTFCCSRRADLIQELTEGWRHKGSDTSRECIAKCYRGSVHRGVLWTVWVRRNADGTERDRFIGCDLLQYQRGQGPGYEWGYKDMCESMHPYYYSCPLKYLDMVPVACEEWRKGVREYHAKRSRKLAVGETYQAAQGLRIGSRRIVSIEVKSLRPLMGTVTFEDGGTEYARFKKRHVASDVPLVADPAS